MIFSSKTQIKANCFSRFFQNPELNQFRQNKTLSRSLFKVKSLFFSQKQILSKYHFIYFSQNTSYQYLITINFGMAPRDFKLYTLNSRGDNIILFLFPVKNIVKGNFFLFSCTLGMYNFKTHKPPIQLPRFPFFFKNVGTLKYYRHGKWNEKGKSI